MDVQLTDDEARALSQAMLAESRAQQRAEAALWLVRWQEATDAKTTVLTQIAATHGFDPTAPVEFNQQARTLMVKNGHG